MPKTVTTTEPVDGTRRDRGLAHTCALHPGASYGPHGPDCVTFCGIRPDPQAPKANGTPIVRDGSSCVVCDAMFDARFR